MSLHTLRKVRGGLWVRFAGTSFTRTTNSPATFRLSTDSHYYAPSGGPTDLVDQGTYTNAPAALEARTTVTSGSFSTDPSAGTFIALSSIRDWTRQAGAAAVQSVTFTLDIRPVGGAIMYSASFTLVCDRT